MTGPERRKVTLTEFLDVCETSWSKKFEVASLAAELEVKPVVWGKALIALTRLLAATGDPERRARILRRWPAAQVVVCTGVAADKYDGGFWPKLCEAVGVSNDQMFHIEWGDAFLANLRRLRLPTFDSGDEDAGTKYVGRILLHSGMPTYCLRDYYRLIGDRRSKVPGLGPDEFVSWASARAARKQLYNVDRPVTRFLQYGGDFAVDVTDRAFDLLDAVAAGGDGSDVPLPERFKEVARQLWAEGGTMATTVRGDRVGRGEVDQKPRLVVDPFGQGLRLRLPAVGDAPDGAAVWLVGLDGVTQRVGTQALFPGSKEPAPQTEVPITGPVRSVTAALVGRQHLQAKLTVVDDKDPFLAFDEDGLLLQPGLPLPGRPTWVLFPGDTGALDVRGAWTVLSESPLPPAWSGWCLVLVDLGAASEVSVGGGRTHPVRRQAAARVVAGEPVRGVRTLSGLTVVPSIPTIQLPAQLDEAVWEVSLLDGTGDLVARWRSGDGDADPNSVWTEVSRPVVGTFTIRVRGPWGRGTTRTVTLIEDLSVTFTPPWRHFVDGGLQPCIATLSVASGVDTARNTIEYAERRRETYVRVGAHSDYRTLVVTPPHMTVAYQSAEVTSSPSAGPLHLFREDLVGEPGTLILDLGLDADPALHFVTSHGVLQTIRAVAGRAGLYRFDLSKLVDTLAVYPQGKLTLADSGGLVVATVRPRRLFTDISLSDGSLEFSDCVEGDGLTALVYAARAPWREPVSLPIVGRRAALPDWLVCAGPLRVVVRIDDPWAPQPVPDWPEPGRSRLVDAAGYITDDDDDDEESKISAFLAGIRGIPTPVADLDRLWTVRALLGSLALGDRTREVAQTIDETLHAEPRKALLSLATSRAPKETIPSLLIRAGLVWIDLEKAHDDSPPIWSARNALPSALLSAADAAWSADEVDAAIDVCGDVVSDLLAGEDPCATSGRLDASAEAFDRQPAMREEFVRQTGLIPTGLLSGDSRIIAAMEFVRERRDPRLEWLMRNAHKVFAEVERLLRIMADPVSQTAFAARRHPTATGGWRVVPAISLGLALAARHAARGHAVAAGWLPRQARIWADLASVVPQLVTIDLILAELLVASASAKIQGRNS